MILHCTYWTDSYLMQDAGNVIFQLNRDLNVNLCKYVRPDEKYEPVNSWATFRFQPFVLVLFKWILLSFRR